MKRNKKDTDLLKICLVIPSLQAGGMERVMSELAAYFAMRKNLEVHLVLYGITREIFYPLPKNVIVHKPNFTFNNKLRFLSALKTLFFLRKRITRISPKTVLSFGEYWNSFVLIALWRLKFPVYISDRCRPDKNLGFIHEVLRKILYKNADGIIVQTQKAREIYQGLFKKSKIAVIGNPIREIPDAKNIKKENIILTVGRLIPSKNHSRLIDSFLRLEQPDWKLVIVGGNALKLNLLDDLREKVRTLGAENRIILTGNISYVDEFYFSSRIFVFTSESEGFPNVIGEAMTAGLPVVSFDCIAGPSEMIKDEINGFLVELNNYKMLENRLLLLMNNPGLIEKTGMAARKSIKQFSLENIGNKYYDFLTNAK